MVLIVLLRGANLGSKRFSPKAVEASLADLDATSIGAAGTFVVRKTISRSALTKRFHDALPFEPELLFADANALKAAVTAGERLDVPPGAKRFATLMSKTPSKVSLPLEAPEGTTWAVRVVRIEGRFAIGLRKSVADTGVYPNPVIEKTYGLRATTRDWPTMEKIAAILG
jgi:hypothetical protein